LKSEKQHVVASRVPINSLTGLRAIAAYAVLAAHVISWTIGMSDNSWQPLAERIAYFGISLFFVLSGFVIQYNYGESLASEGWRGTYNFLIARFGRLYPLYAAVFTYGFYTAGYVPYLDRPDIFISHLTLTQSWIGAVRAYLPASWTISTEWFFYLAFIALARVFVAVPRPGRALLALLTIGMLGLGVLFYNRGLLVSALVSIPGLLNRGDLSINVWDWVTYYSPLTRILEFFVGCLCARMYTPKARALPRFITVLSVGWCAFVIAWGERLGQDIAPLLPNFIYAPAIAAIILVSCESNVFSRVLSSSPMLLGGEISYSVYLLQGTVFGYFRSYMPDNNAVLALETVGIVTVVSILTWLLIERPFRYLIRKLVISTPSTRTR
jgi:peptidoglycan/LPS O-acetylase OafA/YrhL